MTPEEAFEAWWQSLPKIENAITGLRLVDNSVVSHYQTKAAWLACSQRYEREIEAVAKEMEVAAEQTLKEALPGRVPDLLTAGAYRRAANLLRTRLLKGDKP